MKRPRATVRLAFPDAATAQRVAGALQADDDAFARTRADAATVIVDIEAGDVRSVLRAIDDVLANAAVSEAVIKSARLDEPADA